MRSVNRETRVDRRRFLGLAGGAIAGGALAACTTNGKSSSSSTPSTPVSTATTRTTTSSPTTSTTGPPPDAADWETLSRSLSGSLVRPGDPSYGVSSELFNPVFDSIGPQGIAYCQSAADVATCIKFVQDHTLPLAARSGGHSYGGYSSSKGLIIDVTRQNSVTLNSSA